MNDDPRCHHRGAPLKTVRVRVPVWIEHQQMVNGEVETTRVPARYDEEDEVADCPRCTEDTEVTKRTAGQYARTARDFYATPPRPIHKLIPHLEGIDTFAEPMCGNGAVVKTLEALGWECPWVSDIEPQGDMIGRASVRDVLVTRQEDFADCDAIISNPPWPWPSNMRGGQPEGTPTIQIIQHLMQFKPTWFILSSDFAHNRYFEPLAQHCPKIVSVGRVKWMAGTKNTGFDNAAWYLFDQFHDGDGPTFIPNVEPSDAYHPGIEGVL